MDREKLNLNERQDNVSREEIERVKTHLEVECKNYSPAQRLDFWRKMKEIAQEGILQNNIALLTDNLRTKALREFVKSMHDGDFEVDIIYFMGETHLITWQYQNQGKDEKKSLTGDLSSLSIAIRILGYIQVHANYVVNICHIVFIDSKFVYLDTNEKIPLTDTHRTRHKSELDAIKAKLPRLKIDKKMFREPDLAPIRKYKNPN